ADRLRRRLARRESAVAVLRRVAQHVGGAHPPGGVGERVERQQLVAHETVRELARLARIERGEATNFFVRERRARGSRGRAAVILHPKVSAPETLRFAERGLFCGFAKA